MFLCWRDMSGDLFYREDFEFFFIYEWRNWKIKSEMSYLDKCHWPSPCPWTYRYVQWMATRCESRHQNKVEVKGLGLNLDSTVGSVLNSYLGAVVGVPIRAREARPSTRCYYHGWRHGGELEWPGWRPPEKPNGLWEDGNHITWTLKYLRSCSFFKFFFHGSMKKFNHLD